MPSSDPHPTDERRTDDLSRRRLCALGIGAGAALLAGCTAGSTGDGSGGDGGSSPTDSAAPTAASQGTFRLLISDQPVAIDEFDSLDVSFDRARVFRGNRGNGEEEPETATETETETGTQTETATEDDADSESADGQQGFSTLDLDGATVDLTQVVGAAAMSVYEGPLAEGRYTKIELYAAAVEGVVDGAPVDVKIPSGKLMITKPFEVVAGETLSFVFDITVVRKGNGGYNLLPVISESGVAGQDVPVEEVGSASQGAGEGAGADQGSPSGGEGGPPSDVGDGGADGGGGGPPTDGGGQ